MTDRPTEKVVIAAIRKLHEAVAEIWSKTGGGNKAWAKLKDCEDMICELERLRSRPEAKGGWIQWPKHWPKHIAAHYNHPCDVADGPCACGAWHQKDEWKTYIQLYGPHDCERLQTVPKAKGESPAPAMSEATRLPNDLDQWDTPLNCIKSKCSQYWNVNGLGDAEIHSAFEFIYAQALKLESPAKAMSEDDVDVLRNGIKKVVNDWSECSHSFSALQENLFEFFADYLKDFTNARFRSQGMGEVDKVEQVYADPVEAEKLASNSETSRLRLALFGIARGRELAVKEFTGKVHESREAVLKTRCALPTTWIELRRLMDDFASCLLNGGANGTG